MENMTVIRSRIVYNLDQNFALKTFAINIMIYSNRKSRFMVKDRDNMLPDFPKGGK